MKKRVFIILSLVFCNIGNSLFAQDTVCYGGADTLTLTSINSNYQYKWLSRTIPSSTWNTVYDWGVVTTYAIHNITSSIEVICQCDTNSNGIADMVVLNKTITALGMLLPGIIGNDDTICFGQSPNQLSLLSDAVGGGTSYYYYWQQSSNDTSFLPILGENGTTYSPQNLISDKYYRMGFISTAGCGVVYSNSVYIKVLPQLQPATIAVSDTSPICYNTILDSLYVDVYPVGGDGFYSYQWQIYSLGTWVDIPGATGHTYHPSALTSATQFRLAITNDCGTVYSNTISISVRSPLHRPMIASSSTSPVCIGTAPDSLFMTSQPSGGDGDFTYQWQIMNSGTWVDIYGANSITYTPLPLTDTTVFRLKASNSCGVVYSPSVTVPVYPDFSVGLLDTNIAICFQTSTTINFTTMPSGGSGNYSYQWISSIDGVSYSPIANATAANFTTPNLTSTMFYRAVVTTLPCTSDTTNPVAVIPFNQFLPGSIMGSDTVCSGEETAYLQLNASCTGGSAPYTYQWQSSSNGIIFTNEPNANVTYYSPNLSGLIADSVIIRYYRLAFTSSHGCGTVYSPAMSITVLPMLHAAVLGSSTTEPICYNTTPSAVSIVTAPSGCRGFTNQWQVKQGNSWVDISGETASTYQPGPLASTTEYRIASMSVDGCGPVYSQPFTITVYPILDKGCLDSNTFACFNSSATVNFLQSPTGGGDRFLYKWYSSPDNLIFNEIAGANEASYCTGILNADTYYKALVSSYYGCSEDTTGAVLVRRLDPFVGGEINLDIDSTCEGSKPQKTIYLTSQCSGGGKPYSYRWQQSINAIDFVDAPHGNEAYYDPDILFETTYYRLIQSSNYGCGVDTSGVHTIKVNPRPPVYTIIGADTVCYSQYETYHLEDGSPIYDYQWSLHNNSADVISHNTIGDTVEVLWRLPEITDTILMNAENRITNCTSLSKKVVSTTSLSAPPRTKVVRKPNSNILVCEESSDELYYQWGYTLRATNEDYYIENSNRRYVLLPHDFDDAKYHYWVELSPSKESPCYSLSYYEASNDEDIIIPETNKVVVPTSVSGVVKVKIENVNQESVYCQVYSIPGVKQCEYSLGNAVLITHDILNLKPGNTYIIRVVVGSEVFTQRTFVQ